MRENQSLKVLKDFVRQRWLPGFHWAVGREFTDAIGSCAFQEGDILYRMRSAYDAWKGADNVGMFLQVVKSDARAASKFDENWSRGVTIRLYSRAEKPDYVDTTQGGLYSFLHSNRVDNLARSDSHAPLGLGKELRKALREASQPSGSFLVPIDAVNIPSYWKARAITRALDVPCRIQELKNFVDAQTFRRTLVIAAFDCSGLADSQIADRVKAVINPDAKQFNLGVHGVTF